jgi:hypothetical protein
LRVDIDDLELNNGDTEDDEGYIQSRVINKVVVLKSRSILVKDMTLSNDDLIKNHNLREKFYLEGTFAGTKSFEAFSKLREKYEDHEPLTFQCEISFLSKIERIVIQELLLTIRSEDPFSLHYEMILVDGSSN